MKWDEFRQKLASVEDAKLLLMLHKAGREGPDQAYQIIAEEVRRRESGRTPAPAPLQVPIPAAPAPGLQPYATQYATQPALPTLSTLSTLPEMPAWLHEEAGPFSHRPAFVKILLGLGALTALAAGCIIFLGRK